MQWDDDGSYRDGPCRWDDPIGAPRCRMSPEHSRRFWKAFGVIFLIAVAACVWVSFR